MPLKIRPLRESPNPQIILEQLEERIVLDGAVDDVSCRSELLSSQTVDTDSGSHDAIVSHGADAAETSPSLVIESLALETGTEWLQDGTWHYWERDWVAGGNGYEFHAWQDGTSSFHQVQWEAALNSEGTHNGFDYNLQRDGSWTYQSIQWDSNQNGYSYSSTSGGTYSYEARQWNSGLGYDYSSNQSGAWNYYTVSIGQNYGDRVHYMADSSGWWDYSYIWANGYYWHQAGPEAGQPVFHVISDTWSYKYVPTNDTGYWKETSEVDVRFAFHYGNGTWDQGWTGGAWSELGGSLGPAFVGDGAVHQLGNGWGYAYSYSDNTGWWGDGTSDRFVYDYDTGQWQFREGATWTPLATGLGPVDPDVSTGRDLVVAEYVFREVNDIRAGAQLIEWGYDGKITWLSMHHTNDIINLNQFAHSLPGADEGWRTVEDRFRQIGWNGWTTQIGENLFVMYYQQMGDYDVGYEDTDLRDFAEYAVYKWVYDDASSNWGHMYPIMDQQGWHLHYAGVYYHGGVLTMNFSEVEW